MKRLIFVVGAMLAIISLHAAQMRRGQSIIFSTLDNDVTTNTPSLTPRSPELPDFSKSIDVSAPQFDFSAQPVSMPRISPAQIAAMQQSLDQQKNWALMTPAEILGVPTPEKILGIPQRDAGGTEKNQTVMERYLDREYAGQTEATNNTAIYNSSPEWNLPGREQIGMTSEFSSSKNNDNPPVMNSFFGERPAGRATDAKQNGNIVWQKSFTSSTATPAQTPEQLAAAEEFQKLLQPHSSQPSTAPSVFNSLKSSAPDTFLMPAANPSVTAFVPLGGSISTPVGVQPLPGILGGEKPSTAPVAPDWKLKPPPWMSSTPQPGAMPQREF